MRYEAYLREGYIDENEAQLFTDPDDESPNAWLVGVFIDDALAVSIRLHVASRPTDFMPVLRGFPDIVEPRLRAGQLIVDASRMTTQLEFARAYPFLPYLGIRAAFMADDFFEADLITAACREEYEGAYKRMGGAIRLAAPRPYPPLTRPQILMALECREARSKLRSRFPFEHSSHEERETLFRRSSNAEGDFYARFNAHRQAATESGMQHSTTRVA